MAPALAETHAVDDGAGGAARIAVARQFQRQHDILEGVQRRHEVKRLEHEADAFRTHAGAPVLVELAEVHTVQHDITLGRQVQPGEQRQQRRLARSRRSHDRHRLAGRDRETNAGKNSQTALGTANLFTDIVCRKNGGSV